YLPQLAVNPRYPRGQLEIYRLPGVKFTRSQRHPIFRRVPGKIILRTVWPVCFSGPEREITGQKPSISAVFGCQFPAYQTRAHARERQVSRARAESPNAAAGQAG